MKRVLSLIAVLLGLSLSAYAQAPVCGFSVILPSATSSAVILGVQNTQIRICKIIFNVVQGSSPSNFSLITGTGSVCGTNTTQLTLVFTGVASSTQIYDVGFDSTTGVQYPSGVSLCLSLSGTPTSSTVQVIYGII